jgi:tetratricopeptide (TPR) repeat protein
MMSSRPSIWKKTDWQAAAVASLISLAVFVWTAAPNVTLLDSGEFIVAAQHFGVPHPTGYPLWTLLAWLFQLLPLGNAAWEVNIFSGVCGALAVGLTAALLSNILEWCFDGRAVGLRRWIAPCVSLAFSLMLAFSESFWSQAVIAEVYSLHALLVVIFLILCYLWTRQPWRDGLMLGAFFTLAFSFSNHHLVLTLAGMPYLLILLLRRRMFLDWMFAGLLTLLLGYLGFAILSGDPAVLKTAMRFTYCMVLAFGLFVWLRRGRVRWRFVAFLPFAVAVGLLPYAYMPIASATNPPMNWSYTREAQGFFFSINRSQYSGSLSDLTLKSLGRLMGTYRKPAAENPPPGASDLGLIDSIRFWAAFFWQQLMRAFSPIAIVGYFASFLFIFRFTLEKRVWIYLLHLAFVLAAFFQPMTMQAYPDRVGWWLHMPYHTYTNLIFAVLAGLGIGLLIEKLCQKRAAYFWAAPALLVLPVFTYFGAEASSSQRDRWFGWMYGHDMLKDLPKGSIMIGGTDPGRFIPTYMIFGESPQPGSVKRDPAFNRRDLYIITQNALGEPNYMKYLRDHYTKDRPAPRSAFERWLGRETIYPEKPLVLPTREEIRDAYQAQLGPDVKLEDLSSTDNRSAIFGVVLKLLWEKNRDAHDFFVEESFPITWTYDYATPHGLIYRINREKVETLTPEIVAKDFAYWRDYKNRLLADPNYAKDYDAQRSFSKLRQSIANLYKHRAMDKEAEAAYREAIELWPGNFEAVYYVAQSLWDRGDYTEPLALINAAIATDPLNRTLWRILGLAELRQETDGKVRQLDQKLAAQPRSGEILRSIIGLYDEIGETNRVKPYAESALKEFPEDADMMRFLMFHFERAGDPKSVLEPARRLTELESSNATNFLFLARAYFLQGKRPEFYQTAAKAIELGGKSSRRFFERAPDFAPWREEAEFQKLLAPPGTPQNPP